MRAQKFPMPCIRRASSQAVVWRLLGCFLAAGAAAGAQQNGSYIYSFWEEPVPSPPVYICVDTVEGRDLGIGSFNAPEDIFVREDGHIFIADTRNNRIIQTSSDWQVLRIYETWENRGVQDHLDRPGGVFATEDKVYIADTHNRRIVVLQPDGVLLQVIAEPESELIRSEYRYLPLRVVVDRAQRVYAIGPGMYEGIMEFDQDGRFSGFLGSNRVRFNFMDYLWKRLATREQRKGLVLFIPEEFSNLDIDEQGFIYSTTRNEETEHPVKKHNAEGTDVLKREGFFPPVGDVRFNTVGTVKGASTFVDVAVDAKGIYHCLDSKRSRIFSYDQDGNLLSAFGGPGNQRGTFQDPVSLEILEGKLLVLDKALARITVFEPTEYGRLLREAIVRYNSGDYQAASFLWERVLDLNANLELGYTGIGKIQLRRKEYQQAVRSFRLANNRLYYSKAFGHYRKQELRRLASTLLTLIVAAAVALWIYRRFRPRRAAAFDRMRFISPALGLGMRLSFALYILKKPFDGFWDLKHERIGTGGSAAVLLVLVLIVITLKTRFSGFLFNTVNLREYNALRDIVLSSLPIVLFCLGNWSLTSLMDGEGSMRDIFISVVYSLSPILVIFPVITVFSHILVLEEGAFYYFFELLAYIWTGFLLFVSNKTVHNYTIRKTLGMLFLTIVAIGVILFLSLLFVTFAEQVLSFLYSIYREILFRT